MKLVHYDFSAPVEIKNNFLCLAVETDRTALKLAMDDAMTSGDSFPEPTDA